MTRTCTRCQRAFLPGDLARDESKNMEAERKSAGLQGVRFLYYACPDCRMADIFVDVLPIEGETAEDFQTRRDQMEAVARQLHAEQPADAADTVVTAVIGAGLQYGAQPVGE